MTTKGKIRVRQGSNREAHERPIGPRVRADVRLLELGVAASRSEAQALLLAGKVRLGTRVVDKAGALVDRDAALEVEAPPRFVSRGGDKLEGALVAFGLEVNGLVCLDVGASTGGFTDCLLQRGAGFVYAIDVGRGQLHEKLRADARVESREGVNAREIRREDFPRRIELAVIDASFISLAKLLPAVRDVAGGPIVALVKPQFEVGREVASRGKGVVRDPEERERAIARVRSDVGALGMEIAAEADSVLAGPKGNVERFLLLKRVRSSPS